MIRIATFNVENLFARYWFHLGQPPVQKAFKTSDMLFIDVDPDNKLPLTGRAVRAVNADILCLQEIDSLGALDWFNSLHLGGLAYHHRTVVEGNDSRGIDVGLLSRYPIISMRSHRHEMAANGVEKLFSRDCLEVEVDVGGKRLTLYINHFKSMTEGRALTKAKRLAQATRVAEIVDDAWKAKNYEGNFVVVGDLNDYVEFPNDSNCAISPLIAHVHLQNVVDRIVDERDRYTHRHTTGSTVDYRQLDYILIPSPLADANLGATRVGIMRQGMPLRVERYTGPRFTGVGFDNPKASDHAPVWVDINLM